MKPIKSYVIWITQRNGSTLLCKTLELLKFAGKPNEWFKNYYDEPDIFKIYNSNTMDELQNKLWDLGCSDNGIFGIKIGIVEPGFSLMINQIKGIINLKNIQQDIDVINYLFPKCKHIFMTRRNKVRLAVSWWKAIQSNEWHRKCNDKIKTMNINEKYNFNAIKHLFLECSLREAGTQDFFAKSNIIPLTIVYEDFVKNYENTIKTILNYLEIDFLPNISIPKPYYKKLADDISENWCLKFVEELQKDWKYKGWATKNITSCL